MEFEQKVVLVTGGGQGIGKAIAQRLLQAGARVVLAELDAEAGRETAAEFAPLGPVRFVQTDVANEQSVHAAFTHCLSAFGRLDGLVNNAGIANPHTGPLDVLALEAWNRVIATNLTGVLACCKHAVPALREQRGSIVNIASTRALQSEPGSEAYAAAKGGVIALSHALALSLGPQIRVNCISPGWIDVRAWQKRSERTSEPLRAQDHAQHPVGRVGTPEDVAALAAYLLGSQSGFVTGQNFVIDGGMTRKMIYAE
jgi:NAD(P)-dependent dehydrogenase (short-subunit alcohol dehydrogenase family)